MVQRQASVRGKITRTQKERGVHVSFTRSQDRLFKRVSGVGSKIKENSQCIAINRAWSQIDTTSKINQYDGDNAENDRRSSDGEETDEEQRSNFEKSLIIDDEGTLSYAA